MADYNDEIDALLLMLTEEKKLPRTEIIRRFEGYIEEYNYDEDYVWAVNNALYRAGYDIKFEVNFAALAEFDSDYYSGLMSNTTKSMERTYDLICYLASVRDFRLTLASIHQIKMKYLIAMGFFKGQEELFKGVEDKSLKDAFFGFYDKDCEQKEILLGFIEYLGMRDIGCHFSTFRLDMEYVLWTIEKNSGKNGYMYVNTIKVAMRMVPAKYVTIFHKKYFYENSAGAVSEYIKKRDRAVSDYIKAKWEWYDRDGTGYDVFYKNI